MTKKDLQAQAMENEFLGESTATEKAEIPEGFIAINPPTATETPVDIVSQEATDRVKILDDLFKDIARNFAKVGFELLTIRKKKLYKELGFKTFEDFVKIQYGLSKSSAYNFINVCVKYCIRDNDNQPTKLLKREYTKFTSSQLIAMLHMNEEAIAQVDANATVKEIKKLISDPKMKPQDEEAEEVEDEEGDTANNEEEKDKGKKKNTRDMTIPVMRLNMATGTTWESVVTETTRKVCASYLTDEKRTADKRAYKIEINIIYPDESAM